MLTEKERARFYNSFIAALLWSAAGDGDNGDEFEDNDASGIHPHVADQLRAQCNQFCTQNESDLQKAKEEVRYTIDHAGHDFALSRNGHGSGYFDRKLGEVGARLQRAAEDFGPAEAYLGEDGSIYVSGLEPKQAKIRSFGS